MTRRSFTYSPSGFNLLTSLMQVYNQSNPNDTNATIAKYLLNHYDELELVNIYDVASECFVSRASIQRFSKSIGFESFTDLKLAHAANEGHLDALAAYGSERSFIQDIEGRIVSMLRDVLRTVDTPQFDRVLELLHDAQDVFVVSATTSHTGAHAMQEDLFVAGRLMRIVADDAGMQDAMAQLSNDDLLMVISTTGIFAYAVRDRLEGVKAHKLLLTMNTSEEVSLGFDTTLLVGEGHLNEQGIPSHGIRDIYTRYGMPFFLDLLSHAYVSRYGRPEQA